MELLYVEEHLDCYLYDNPNDPIIRFYEKEKGEETFFKSTHNQLIFLLEGEIRCSSAYCVNQVFEAGTFFLLPCKGNHTMKMEAEEKSKFIMVRMHQTINFCNHFPLTMLSKFGTSPKKMNNKPSLYSLRANEIVDDWMKSVAMSTSVGLKCIYFQELKQKEVLYYLRVFYSKEDLYAFFSPILNNDAVFTDIIYRSYESAKSIDELAHITNYSMSGFKKNFAKVFGMPPATWIRREKAKKIYYDINCTSKSFKEIAVEYDFSSPAHFDRFCKSMYSVSPGTLRENTQNRISF